MARGLQARMTLNSMLCVQMVDAKWPLLKPYTAQSNFARILDASVISELYSKHAGDVWLTSDAGE